MFGKETTMKHRCLLVIALGLLLSPAKPLLGDSIDGRVVRVDMPVEDITLLYVETAGAFSVQLETASVSVRGTKFYLGDGKVAVELASTPLKGIVFQGRQKLEQGYKFKRWTAVEVQPGYKQAADLMPGDIYLVLAAVRVAFGLGLISTGG
jgi:hypothetical protein